MEVSVIGRVNNLNLPLTKGILPVFEAVINSIQSCIDLTDNKIELHILRNSGQQELIDDEALLPDITGFMIVDNGPGFTEDNYLSFTTSDSTKKVEIGGKGVGRFLWLKAFEGADIESTYRENGRTFHRHFSFIMKGNGIDNHSIEDLIEKSLETVVVLERLKGKYLKYMPKKVSSIAQRLFDYCLSYYISGKEPNVYVIDDYSGESISLLGIYKSQIVGNANELPFMIGDANFKLTLIRYPTSSETTHKIVYCAHMREVKSENLADQIPLMCKRLSDETGSEYVVYAYITSEWLDSMVNSERTSFSFESEDESQEPEFDGMITLMAIRRAAIPLIRVNVDAALSTIKKDHIARISTLVKENIPEYRSVLKYCSESVYNISPALTNDKIELELHKIQQQMERDAKQKSKELIAKEPKNEEEEAEYYINYERMAEELSDLGKDKLVQYVIHRKSIIRLFENRLKKKDNGDYPLEEAIHQLIIPMKTTSDDTEYNKQNLWMIDEKLAYHYYLASDMRMKKGKKGDAARRPDVMIFDKPIAFTDDSQPYSSVVIIEFKRPQRDDYTESDNPIIQVQDYIRIIRRGEAQDRDGRPIVINDTSKFFVYIICDITKKLDELAENQAAIKSPDNMGYFWFNPYLKAYFEIVPFEKLLADAKKRNRILFDKLGLPNALED